MPDWNAELKTDQNPPPEDNRFDDIDDARLTKAAVSDPKALSVLYRRHYASIYGYVYRRIGNAHDTSDIVSEVFVSMIRYLPRYRWIGAPFRSWLLRLATSQINRWVRKRKWFRFWHPLDDTHHREVKPTDSRYERLECLRLAISDLPIRFQTVLALYYFEEQSIESISQILNCPAGTVKSRLSRARDALRAILSNREEELSNEQQSIGVFTKRMEV